MPLTSSVRILFFFRASIFPHSLGLHVSMNAKRGLENRSRTPQVSWPGITRSTCSLMWTREENRINQHWVSIVE
ncbi:uncharacterized protein BDW47DRAFT_50586 [Aspergillus candidus]|uniref:Uncharacterized protein n=1 Tax=Aspergillus candidus TaxID=41067 RepID=A0A2I2F6S6_ASPCN|nr:hypothetical protein BDW47DRAFT_50586 [Aspergillus candidus]PLB36311.1 hypothetical protein BDW47DRAFT_50586 [Aspergillus candidus]